MTTNEQILANARMQQEHVARTRRRIFEIIGNGDYALVSVLEKGGEFQPRQIKMGTIGALIQKRDGVIHRSIIGPKPGDTISSSSDPLSCSFTDVIFLSDVFRVERGGPVTSADRVIITHPYDLSKLDGRTAAPSAHDATAPRAGAGFVAVETAALPAAGGLPAVPGPVMAQDREDLDEMRPDRS